MKRALSLVTMVAALSIGSVALAKDVKEHEIMILPNAYFPEVTYVKPGDTVRFVNISGSAHSIVGENDAWAIGPIPNKGEAILDVTGKTKKTFFNTDDLKKKVKNIMQGDITFEKPSLK